jgi:predicted  nucleic acid-binding Zn-ribbon protein
LPKYIVPYEDAAQLEHELNQCKRELEDARERATTAWSDNLILDSRNRQLERELAEANRRACEYYLTGESVMVMDSPEAVREARKKAAKRMIDMERELAEARGCAEALLSQLQSVGEMYAGGKVDPLPELPWNQADLSRETLITAVKGGLA